MSETCVFCDEEIADDAARFVSARGTAAHPDCLFEGYPDAEGNRWRFAAGHTAINRNLAGQSVYVARISHRHGDDIYVSATGAGMDRQIYAYVEQNWSDFAETDAGAVPEDVQEAIRCYFEMAEDREYIETDYYPIGD